MPSNGGITFRTYAVSLAPAVRLWMFSEGRDDSDEVDTDRAINVSRVANLVVLDGAQWKAVSGPRKYRLGSQGR